VGLHINIAVTLQEIFRRLAAQGRVITLGVQDVAFTREAFNLATGDSLARAGTEVPSAAEYFRSCGLSGLETLDVSDFEGAEHIVDLNQAELPEHLVDKYGCVLNGGTLEHVFHLPNALTSITRMLAPGGLLVHVYPVHNWVDHGLYQINPILLHCYYAAARFDILESRGLLFSPASGDQLPWEVVPYPIGALAEGLCGTLDERAMLGIFVARKRHDSLHRATPVQPMYRGSAESPRAVSSAPLWFPRYELLNGRRIREWRTLEFDVGPFNHQGGNCWACSLPSEIPAGDDVGHPVRSPLALFEDDALQTPAHSAHSQIRTFGYGSYSHWRNELYFSASDNSDPNSNGRKYRVILPKQA
jgi:SAM-dependent methyltransferase